MSMCETAQPCPRAVCSNIVVVFDKGLNMTDPRNIAHDKRVRQEKKHHGHMTDKGSHAMYRPGRKPHIQRPPNPEPMENIPEQDEQIDSGPSVQTH